MLRRPSGKARVNSRSGQKVTPWPTPSTSRGDILGVVTPPPEADDDSDVDSTPFADSDSTSSSAADSMRRSSHIRGDPPNPPPRRSSMRGAAVIIQEPPADNPPPAAESATPQKQRLLPALNLIPATPQALGGAAERAKQLQLSPTPLATPALEKIQEPELDDDRVADLPERPSLAEIPDDVRESKLHPWWQPKTLQRSVTAPAQPVQAGEKVEGRPVKRIPGTKLVIEFVGLRTFSRMLRRKPKGVGEEEKKRRRDTMTT